MVVEGTKSLVFISLKQKNMLKIPWDLPENGVPQHPVLHDYHKTLHFGGYIPQFQTHFYVATTKVISSNFRTSRDSIHNSRGDARPWCWICQSHWVRWLRWTCQKDLLRRHKRVEKIHEIQPFNPCIYNILYGVPCSFSGVLYFD